MDTMVKNVMRIALIMLYLALPSGLFALTPDSTISTTCTQYGMVYAPYDDDCYFYIVLDNGVLLQPELSSVPEILFPDGPTRVKVGYEVVDSINGACGIGLFVYLTCIEIVYDSIGCNAYFTYSQIWCDPLLMPFECENGIQFFNYSSGDIIETHWDFGDGSVSNEFEPVHYYEEPGVYEVCLTITTSDSCSSEYCARIEVGDTVSCMAFFEYYMDDCIDPLSDCIGGEMIRYFQDMSQGSIIQWSWDFGDGTTSEEQNPVHEFTEPGYYNVCLTITTSDSCSSQYCTMVEVGVTPDCMAMFDYYPAVYCDDALSKCIGSTVMQLVDYSYGNIISWLWDFGDGTTSSEQNPIHEFPDLGEYLVCLNISSSDSCYDTYCALIDLGQTECHALFDYCNYSSSLIMDSIPPDTIPGDSIPSDDLYLVGFRNLSEGEIDYYWWDFGDGGYSSDENPVHAYEYPGYYTVCLTISSYSGCYDTYCTTVNIGSIECNIDFTYEIVFPNCSGFEPAYLFSPVFDGPFWSVYWDFGDGYYSFDEHAVHIYDREGIYTVCVEVYYENNCYASLCENIEVTLSEQDSAWYNKCNPSDIPDIPVNDEFSILEAYPNPASDQLHLVLNSPSDMSARIELVNILGQVQHLSEMYSLHTGENHLEIDLSLIETGTYIYLIYSTGGVLHGRINIVR